jgi:hypothetical protein
MAGREVTSELVEPKAIRHKMNLWRQGLTWIPEEYIKHHVELARIELVGLQSKFGIRVHHKRLEDDGWFDGMKGTVAIIETRKGRVLKLKWHDSSATFFRCCDSGGSARMQEEELM